MNITSMNIKAENNHLKRQISDFKSGEAYIKLEQKKDREMRRAVLQVKKEAKKQISEIRSQHREQIRTLNEKAALLKDDFTLEISRRDNQIYQLKHQLTESDQTVHQLRATIDTYSRDQLRMISQHEKDQQEIERLKRLVDELTKSREIADEIIRRQTAIIEKDYTNSSIPSSRNPNHATIHNSRKRSGKKKGGQPGHKGSRRPDLKSNEIIDLEVPDCVRLNPDQFVLLDETRCRKVVSIHVSVYVKEYRSRIWKDVNSGKLVYSQFPDNCVNELNYDETVKAFACLLTNSANVSIRKAQAFLRDVSQNQISLSTGMINNLRSEFDQKSKAEQNELRRTLLTSPFMNIDTTFTRINGKTGSVGICTCEKATQFTAGEKKGHILMDGTPANDYMGTVIHDGEKTMNKYGEDHQQCLVHINRYLIGIHDNEPDKSWAPEMRTLLYEMEARHKSETGITEQEAQEFERRYDGILDLADSEYPEGKPAGYIEGFNTKKRMRADKGQILYFLRHPEIPFHNNMAEQKAREIKRKTKASDGFRSLEGAETYCNVKSVLVTARQNNVNEYELTKEIFSRTKSSTNPCSAD